LAIIIVSSDIFEIEVNGVSLEAKPGQMLIEVTDAADIYVPRFCYHRNLSVAANCRMCLVEVENAPKPMPACATPVANGMKVFTKSAKAIAAQKAVMEFLLINHPLDCPICDQGGECELQDIAMGFGRGISRYTEGKRVVADKDLGPLVSTDMTRCIHCTRCVRFGQEIAGIQELGTIGRGENTEISAFIEKSVDHELSGNIIDLCPVGALNSKPYRFTARAWEMVQLPTISPHDCVGANLYAHVKQGKLKRIVPRTNDAINEGWATDRDRFSYEGIYATDRLETPIVRDDGEWRQCSWEEALDIAAEGLRRAGADLSALVSPSATLEEGHLIARLVRHLGSDNIDHRLRRRDFRQENLDPLYPWLGMQISDIAEQNSILMIGSNLRREVPMLAHWVRKAALAGASVAFINPAEQEYLFPVAEYIQADDLVAQLAQLVAAAADGDGEIAKPLASIVANAGAPDSPARGIVATLTEAGNGAIFIGQIGMRHPRFAELRRLAAELARLTGCKLGFIPEGANTGGLSLAGVLPHRAAGGEAVTQPGANAAQIVRGSSRGLVLFGVEPELDCADGELTSKAMESAEFVLALTPYLSDELNRHADVVLPIGTFAETSGTFVNVAGEWQSFAGVASPVGEARPGWKVLRVLGNLLELPACDYESSEAVRDELRAIAGALQPDNLILPESLSAASQTDSSAPESLDVPMYRIDPLVRRAEALQRTRDGQIGMADDDERKIA
jgi:NADH-quinone oxidoreductase subunit G